jgi:hypothetical protein
MTTTHDRTAPTVANDAWIAPGVILIGDLTIGSGASVWFDNCAIPLVPRPRPDPESTTCARPSSLPR